MFVTLSVLETTGACRDGKAQFLVTCAALGVPPDVGYEWSAQHVSRLYNGTRAARRFLAWLELQGVVPVLSVPGIPDDRFASLRKYHQKG